MPTLEQRITTIERNQARILFLLTADKEFISEDEAMKILSRSKRWLKDQRNGVAGIPPTLIQNKDWRYINGRTPEYKRSSIDNLKNLLIQKTA